MKKTTEEFLIDYLSTHLYGKYTDYDFDSLFKIYSALEVSSLSDLHSAITDFCGFLEDHSHLIETADPKYKERIPSKINSLKYKLNTLFNLRNKQNQKRFAEIVTKIAPSKNSHTLDVGASAFPYSSIIIAKKLEHVTSMDNVFDLSDISLHSMNVEAKEQYFDDNTIIDDYDMVVGRYPCSAIIPIVKACSKANKPYFLELCDCKIPWPQKRAPGKYFGWENVLPEFDPNVQVLDGYAFNVDASPNQMKKIIAKLNSKRVLTPQNQIYNPRKDIQMPTAVFSSQECGKNPDENEMT